MSVLSVKSIKKKEEKNIWLQTVSGLSALVSSHATLPLAGGREGAGPSGGDRLDVVGRIEAHLAAAQPPFAPALLVLLAQLQQFLACRGQQSQRRLIQNTVQIKWLGQIFVLLSLWPEARFTQLNSLI